MNTLSRDVKFDDFYLSQRMGTLQRGGKILPLTGRAFALLTYFTDHPGELVSKEQLLAHVWQGRIVTDAAMSKRIQEVRAALNDDAMAPRYIQTVARRGYRFIGGSASMALSHVDQVLV